MPSGRTHDRITLLCLFPVLILGLLASRDGRITLILGAAFVFSGLMFGPDLDIYSVQFKRWGPFKFLWLPYRKILRHRSLISHGLVVGTLFRLIYFFSFGLILAIVTVGLAQLIWGFPWNWQSFMVNQIKIITTNYYKEAIAVLIGLELGSMSHSLSDWIVSAFKKQKKKSLKVKTTNLPRNKKKSPPKIK